MIISNVIFAWLNISIQVSATEEDLGVREGDKFTWKVIERDKDYYPTYHRGDEQIIEIESIAYYEDPEVWIVTIDALEFTREKESDKLSSDIDMTIYKKTSSIGYGYIIPNEDIEKYLKDIDKNSNSYKSDGNIIINNYTDTKITREYNDLGILETYTEEYKKEITLQYELTNSGSTISFGATFLFVLPIGILMGIYFYSKSRKKEALNQ